MTDSTEQFDKNIYDAYSRIEMDEMTQNRMLDTLLSAQERREADTLGKTVMLQRQGEEDELEKTVVAPLKTPVNPSTTERRASHAPSAPVPAPRRKRPAWQAWLPIAAVMAIAAVVVSTRFVPSSASNASIKSDAEMAQTEASDDAAKLTSSAPAADESTVSYDAESMAEESSGADEAASENAIVTDYVEGTDITPPEEYSSVPATYPLIMLDDGTQMTVVQTGSGPVAVDSNLLGDLVGEGVAVQADASTDSTVSCEVYQIQGDSESFAACYDGTYWLCVRS